MESLHPGVKWLFRVQSYVGFVIFFIFFAVSFIMNSIEKGAGFSSLLLISLLILLGYILLTEIFVRLGI